MLTVCQEAIIFPPTFILKYLLLCYRFVITNPLKTDYGVDLLPKLYNYKPTLFNETKLNLVPSRMSLEDEAKYEHFVQHVYCSVRLSTVIICYLLPWKQNKYLCKQGVRLEDIFTIERRSNLKRT